MLKELENLRLQVRDRDLKIIKLHAQIRAMKCCENCKHAEYDGFDYACVVGGKCSKPEYKKWELKK